MDKKTAETMTDAETAVEKRRKEDLAAEIERMDDVELQMLAQRVKVSDLDKLTKRADIVAAVELKAEADAALGRKAIRDMEEEEARSVASEDDRRSPVSLVLRRLNAAFCADIPQSGRGGSFSPDDDPGGKFDGSYDVPDGKYRVGGSDWIFSIKKKKLEEAFIATPANKYGGKGVIAVE